MRSSIQWNADPEDGVKQHNRRKRINITKPTEMSTNLMDTDTEPAAAAPEVVAPLVSVR